MDPVAPDRAKVGVVTPATALRCFWRTALLLAAVNVARTAGLLWRPWLAAALLVGGVAVLALAARASAADLGLEPGHAGRGLRYGVAACLVVLVVLAVAAALPGTSDFLHDSRAEVSAARLGYDVAVIVLVTVIPEELAFRGLLLGSALVLWRPWRAAVASSVLFGLWHIAPTLHTMSGNTAVRGLSGSTSGRALVVLGAVLSTFAAGLAFSWLRLRSRSLAAPALAHVATNALALTVAWFVVH